MKKKFDLRNLKSDEPFDPEIPDEVIAEAEARARALREAEELSASQQPEAPTAAEPVTADEVREATHASDQGPDPDAAEQEAPVFGVPLDEALPPDPISETATAVPQSSGVIARADIDQYRRSFVGVITRGDKLPDVPAPKPMTEDQRLAALGIPPRPQTWPSFMAWPPQVVLERFMSADVDAEQRAEMIAELLEMDRRMLLRSRQINDWLNVHGATKGGSGGRLRRGQARQHPSDPHFGLKWATLINSGPHDLAIAKTVVNWSQSRAVTLDGGVVVATDDAISFGGERGVGGNDISGLTPQAIKLGIQEARNRGWKSINLTGSYEFGQMAIHAAREAGIEATVRYRGKGAMFWKTYTVKVMPNIPTAAVLPEPGAKEGEHLSQTPQDKPSGLKQREGGTRGSPGKVREQENAPDIFGQPTQAAGGEPGPSIH